MAENKVSTVKSKNYVTIQGWMITDLRLKGNDLIIYAIIYGFSQSGEGQKYTGSLRYLADWTNSTKQGVMKNLKSLADRGLIYKSERIYNGVKFVEYYASEVDGIQQSLMGYATKFNGGMQQSLPNNIDINNIDKNIESMAKPTHTPKGSTKFIPPSVNDVREYCKERNNNVDPERFVDFYSCKGWMVGKNKMKDWKAAVRTWEKRDNNTPKNTGHPAGANLDDLDDLF